MENVVTSLEALTNVILVHAVETRFAGMQEEQRRLQSELEGMENECQYYEEIKSLQGTFETAIAGWPTMSRGEKRALLHTFIDRIEAVDPQQYGGIRLIVYW